MMHLLFDRRAAFARGRDAASAQDPLRRGEGCGAARPPPPPTRTSTPSSVPMRRSRVDEASPQQPAGERRRRQRRRPRPRRRTPSRRGRRPIPPPPPTIMREVVRVLARWPARSVRVAAHDERAASDDERSPAHGHPVRPVGGHSVATLRDLATNAQYRVVRRRRRSAACASPPFALKTVVFTIDEFGTTRQDSLVLGDSTKARGK